MELADTQVSEACGRKALGVQVPPSAPNSMFGTSPPRWMRISCAEGKSGGLEGTLEQKHDGCHVSSVDGRPDPPGFVVGGRQVPPSAPNSMLGTSPPQWMRIGSSPNKFSCCEDLIRSEISQKPGGLFRRTFSVLGSPQVPRRFFVRYKPRPCSGNKFFGACRSLRS